MEVCWWSQVIHGSKDKIQLKNCRCILQNQPDKNVRWKSLEIKVIQMRKYSPIFMYAMITDHYSSAAQLLSVQYLATRKKYAICIKWKRLPVTCSLAPYSSQVQLLHVAKGLAQWASHASRNAGIDFLHTSSSVWVLGQQKRAFSYISGFPRSNFCHFLLAYHHAFLGRTYLHHICLIHIVADNSELCH